METFDYDVVDKIYDPYDNLGLSVILHGDGTREYKVVGALAEAVKAQSSNAVTVETPERNLHQQIPADGFLYNHRERLCIAES